MYFFVNADGTDYVSLNTDTLPEEGDWGGWVQIHNEKPEDANLWDFVNSIWIRQEFYFVSADGEEYAVFDSQAVPAEGDWTGWFFVANEKPDWANIWDIPNGEWAHKHFYFVNADGTKCARSNTKILLADEDMPEGESWAGWFEVPTERPKGGYVWDVINSEWIKSFPKLQHLKKKEAEKKYQEKLDEGFNYQSKIFQTDLQSMATVNNFMTGLLSGFSNPHGGYYRALDNTHVVMDDLELGAFLTAIGVYFGALRANLHALKNSSDAAGIQAELDVIDIDTGWPPNTA